MLIAKNLGVAKILGELLHPKQARKVSGLLGKRPVATKSFASRFICVPDGPNDGFFFSRSVLHCRWIREICENSSVPRHFLTIQQGLYFLTPLGPISVHATSLRQAEQLTYVGSVTRIISHFVSRSQPPGRLYKGTMESKILGVG